VPGTRAARVEAVNERTLAWLRDRDDGPFFLFINYMDAHIPYNTTPRRGFLEDVPPYSRQLERMLNQAVLSEDYPIPKQLIRRFMNQYDLALANLDDGIGRLLDSLRQLGLYEQSLVIITSDHGEYFGEHRLIEHSKDVYEPAMWIPLFVKYPEQTMEVTETRRISLVHLPRLILRTIGLEQKVDPDLFPYSWPEPVILGENKWALWKDLLMPWGGRFNRVRKVMYKGPFKYIESTDGEHELYNLSDDSGERRNLLDESSPLKERWARLLKAHWPDNQHDASERSPEEMTEEEVKRAEALGYIWSTPQDGGDQ
jgi:arylsulfatase A-like enzyme